MKFTVVLSPDPSGGFTVSCPALPGCVSEGDSEEQALGNIREAIVGVLAARTELNLAAPRETTDVIAEEIRETLKDRAKEGLPLTIETREVEVEAGVRA